MEWANWQRLRHLWPLAGVLATFLAGFAVAGFGGAVLAGGLSVLFFGPAYLVQNTIRYRRGSLPPPPAKTPEEKAQHDARILRLYAISELLLAGLVILLSAIGRPSWLSHSQWTPLLLLAAASAVAGAPYIWAIADRRANGRSPTWARALTGLFDIAFGLAAVGVAVTNQRSHWIGGPAWTIVFALAGAAWLLGAPSAVASARR